MHKFYVDVPYGYVYKWQNKKEGGDEALVREFGVNIKFICNAHGAHFNQDNLGAVGNKGDAHMVELESEKDELFFLIKTGWTKLNTEVVENYIKTKRKR